MSGIYAETLRPIQDLRTHLGTGSNMPALAADSGKKASMSTLADFKIGDRVELHPGLDLWMRGARFGEVVAIGRKYVSVRLDRTGTIARLPANRLEFL